MMRTIIEVPDGVVKDLDRIGRRQKRSRAAIIRDAIAAYLEKEAVPERESAFGLWKERKVDALRYQDALRSEWDER